jgi:ABC-type iron transport system FetAB ATPase subunit
MKDVKDGTVVEFKYNLEENLFTPYRVRNDKNKPNGEITVLNTIKNIQEAIKIEDF